MVDENRKEYLTKIYHDKFNKLSPDSQECADIKGSDCYSFINREILKK